ncbi:hypothetical protein CRUP_004249, partial [Coryphaenoides rupestris]
HSRPPNIPAPPPLIPTSKHTDKPSFIQGGSISQGTPGTYLPSHAIYGLEGSKSSVGSISLGLPRQQDHNKPGSMPSIQDGRGNPGKVGEGLAFRGSITQMPKGMPTVIYEGKIGHIVSYDAISKNPREATRSPRSSHDLKRSYDSMMESPMARGHPGREGAPFEERCLETVSMEIQRKGLSSLDPLCKAYDDSPKYKHIKRESPPIRSIDGCIGKGKPYEGVNTIKEMGRSIHEIPRQDQAGGDSRQTPDMSDRRVLEGPMSQSSTIKHNVKSLITSLSGKMAHGLPPMEAMERGAKYEEGKAAAAVSDRVRQSVVNSTGSVLRSTHQDQAGRTQLSPGVLYEDANAAGRRTTPAHERKSVMTPTPPAYIFPRQPSPTGYSNTYQLYTMETTRQTILNDYITSQQMQVIPRPDLARGLSPREQSMPIPYPGAPRGIIDLAQMPPTLLLPHPGATGSHTLERMAFLPGAQPPFPPRPFNQASISQ